jgi:hypothetical protein
MTSTFGTYTYITMTLYYRYQASDEGGGPVEESQEHDGVQEVYAAERETPRDHIAY